MPTQISRLVAIALIMIHGTWVYAKPIETYIFEESLRLGKEITVERAGESVWLSYHDVRLEDLIQIMNVYYSGAVKLHARNNSPILDRRLTGRLKISDLKKAINLIAKHNNLDVAISSKGNYHLFPQ